MSFEVIGNVEFPQPVLRNSDDEDPSTSGGILSDLKHVWHANGSCLEIRNTTLGKKIAAWNFGGPARDQALKIVAVDEIKRPNGKLPFLLVALHCPLNGGIVCVFHAFGCKVVRAVLVGQQITSAYVIDAGRENTLLPESSPLRYFDGTAVLGTLGGDIYLLDICRQICEDALYADATKDESNPARMVVLPNERSGSVKDYVKKALEDGDHLAINLNEAHTSEGHFALKGENGEDRVHVNKSETEVSATYYAPQIACLMVGYNFGAFQLWDLGVMGLVYTSPVCEDLVPVTGFALQEPVDDPKAYCYAWVLYGQGGACRSVGGVGFPYAVMYSLHYAATSAADGHAHKYENFQHCSLRFQIELGQGAGGGRGTGLKRRFRGGSCLGLQTVSKRFVSRGVHTLSLCLVSWTLWDSGGEAETHALLFDLNQWYKEQMPAVPDWSDCAAYVLSRRCVNGPLLDVKLDPKSLVQFVGVQNLEEHFFPTSLSFDLVGLGVNGATKLRSRCAQVAFTDDLVADGHLSLVRPGEYYERSLGLGLAPLFCDVTACSSGSSNDTEFQREVLLSVALEQKLVGWLCGCATKLANAAFHASGLSLDGLMGWAFRRATALKTSCDAYCTCLFDHSRTRLDDHALALIGHAASQIDDLVALYDHVADRLLGFVGDRETVLEGRGCLKNVAVYLDVLLWMVNVGLLPEGPATRCRLQELTRWYDEKRARVRRLSVGDVDRLLFVDNLVENGAEPARERWREDGGTGFYPPPSLQSVLAVYLAEGVDTRFKHSLVTYALLDIATSEDARVATLLSKFPQIFGLDQSVSKIVVAFWHLDHDDYRTAVEHITAPCVSPDDLRHWHHRVMMRSLLLHEQYDLALLYFRVAKPPITDDADVSTVLSLLISKSMVSEAFEFERRHRRRNDDDALLMHIFNECNKNHLLHNVLYRCLGVDEERAFFKYVKKAAGTECDELRLCYYLLRSRFLEAFEAYDASKRKKSECGGLAGRRDANPMDDVVRMFRDQLPHVNRDLVETARRENLDRRNDHRPTPMSVFVHNPTERARYKSSLMLAAMSKAKLTFGDDQVVDGVGTEGTPFLRTPTASTRKAGPTTPVVVARVIHDAEEEEEEGDATPRKRLRLTPRASTGTPATTPTTRVSAHSRMLTPIVRRKSTVEEGDVGRRAIPHGILKTTPARADATATTTTTKTPRTPLARTPIKGHVKFDDMHYPSPDDGDAIDVPRPVADESHADRPVAQSPRARRSYKRSFADSVPVRSSPRLSAPARNASNDAATPTLPDKPKGRKSMLTRRGVDQLNRERRDAADSPVKRDNVIASDEAQPYQVSPRDSTVNVQASGEPQPSPDGLRLSTDTSLLSTTSESDGAEKDESLRRCLDLHDSAQIIEHPDASDGTIESDAPHSYQQSPGDSTEDVRASDEPRPSPESRRMSTDISLLSTTYGSESDYAETDESLRKCMDFFANDPAQVERPDAADSPAKPNNVIVSDEAQPYQQNPGGSTENVQVSDEPRPSPESFRMSTDTSLLSTTFVSVSDYAETDESLRRCMDFFGKNDEKTESPQAEVVQRTPGTKSLVRKVLERNTFKRSSYILISSANTGFETDSEYPGTDESLRENAPEKDVAAADDEEVEEREGVAVYDDLSSLDGDASPEDDDVPLCERAFLDGIEILSDDDEKGPEVASSAEESSNSSGKERSDDSEESNDLNDDDDDEHMDSLVVDDDEHFANQVIVIDDDSEEEKPERSEIHAAERGDSESPEGPTESPEGPKEEKTKSQEEDRSSSGQGKEEDTSTDGHEDAEHPEEKQDKTSIEYMDDPERDSPDALGGAAEGEYEEESPTAHPDPLDEAVLKTNLAKDTKDNDSPKAEVRVTRRKSHQSENTVPASQLSKDSAPTSETTEDDAITEPKTAEEGSEEPRGSPGGSSETDKTLEGEYEEESPSNRSLTLLPVKTAYRHPIDRTPVLKKDLVKRTYQPPKKLETEDKGTPKARVTRQGSAPTSQTSEDEAITKPKVGKKRGRSASVDEPRASVLKTALTPIDEEGGSYAGTRRLTRRQANMLKAKVDLGSVTAFELHDTDKLRGRVDLRASSESRTASMPPASFTGMKMRLRSASVDADLTPHASKKSKKDEERESTPIMTRSRARSTSSTRSDTSQKSTASSAAGRRRKTSTLSGIREEETK